MKEVLVPIGHHRPPPVPATSTYNVYRIHRERVGGAHNRANVGVVLEILNGHMQIMPTGINIGNDGLPRPVPVGVHNVAPIAFGEQRGVETRIGGQRLTRMFYLPRPDTNTGFSPLGGAGVLIRQDQDPPGPGGNGTPAPHLQ